jgi:hypothetical protein
VPGFLAQDFQQPSHLLAQFGDLRVDLLVISDGLGPSVQAVTVDVQRAGRPLDGR